MTMHITATRLDEDGCPYWTLAGDDEAEVRSFLDHLPGGWFHEGLEVCRVRRGARTSRVKAALAQAASRRGLRIDFVEPREHALARAVRVAKRRVA
jgi:hypothetical protein